MKAGETIFFDTEQGQHRATIAVILFSGTSRHIPDANTEPWHELLIVESQTGNLVVRDRTRVKVGDEVLSQHGTWYVGDRDKITDWISERVLADSDDDDRHRLYSRAFRALAKSAKAIAV